MKMRLLSFILLSGMSLVTVACSPDNDPLTDGTVIPAPDPGEPDEIPDNSTMNRNITIRAGSNSFTATLEDNEAGKAFAALLPMTVNMNEMNGNEKYHNLSGNLPTNSSRPGTIRTGDLMLYGSNCLVLFYATFSSSYSYTRLGRVNNPDGLATALGNSNVTVTFDINN